MIAIIVALGCWVAAAAAVSYYFASVEPYMDEVFHIPQVKLALSPVWAFLLDPDCVQAQKYCAGDFSSWDPKITTFPGMYLTSAIASKISTQPCGVVQLRALNFVFGALTLVVLYRLIRRGEPREQVAAARALSVALYPPHFFFSFLFYTDVGSAFWVLLAVDLSTPEGDDDPSVGRLIGAALAGTVAILFRQTNAAWVLFACGIACVRDLEKTPRPVSTPRTGVYAAAPYTALTVNCVVGSVPSLVS
jgi:alpha-1,2-glucosyltransferase